MTSFKKPELIVYDFSRNLGSSRLLVGSCGPFRRSIGFVIPQHAHSFSCPGVDVLFVRWISLCDVSEDLGSFLTSYSIFRTTGGNASSNAILAFGVGCLSYLPFFALYRFLILFVYRSYLSKLLLSYIFYPIKLWLKEHTWWYFPPVGGA